MRRRRRRAKHVLVNGGADVARQFLNAGLVDELRLHLVPVILGVGVRLFDGVHPDLRLVAREAHSHPGVTHSIYDLGRAAASE
jgi:dihydrofolate reductase